MKKYTRSTNNKILFGVFGGLGEYYETDPTIYRLIGLLLFFLSGIIPFILVYIAAIFLVPKDGEDEKDFSKRRNNSLKLLLIILAIILIVPLVVMLVAFMLFRVSGEPEVEYFSPRHSQVESQIVYELPAKKQENIVDYLNENIISSDIDSEVFSYFHTFSVSENEIYVWAIVSEYYLDDNNLVKRETQSLPLSLSFKNNEISSHYYLESSSDLEILNFESQRADLIENMETYIHYQALNYFGV